jgi:hypothetical protein
LDDHLKKDIGVYRAECDRGQVRLPSILLPITTSPGHLSFGPQLSLACDSGSSNNPIGFGWSLSMPSNTGKMEKRLPRHDDTKGSDIFRLSSAEDLVPVLVQKGAHCGAPSSGHTTDPNCSARRGASSGEGRVMALIRRG